MDTIIRIQALGQNMMPTSDRGESGAVSGQRVEMWQTAVKKPK